MDNLIVSTLEGMPIILLVGVIFISLYVLGKAADYLVEEAIVLSEMLKIPKVIVGATIISLGTTIPEVTVSVMSAANGKYDLALGNAIGSVITNTTLILGIVSLIGTVPLVKSLMKKQGGNLVASAILLTLVSLPIFSSDGVGRVSRKMGIIFIILLIVYLFRSISGNKYEETGEEEREGSTIVQLIKIFLGIIIVIASSKVLIPSVELVAVRIGIPESVIAATLVAFGTSVPELMTAITAVRKGYGELAVGNILGANILNILFVIGSSALVSKDGLIFPSLYYRLQIPMMVLVTVYLYIIGINKDGKIRKKDGIALLVLYGLYTILNYSL